MEHLAQYNVFAIPVSEVYFDMDFNCRDGFTLESVSELADSIRENGLKFPLVIQPWDKQPGVKYRLVAGHRRFRAMTQVLKADTIPAMIVEGLDDNAALRLNLLENLERKDLNILEEAKALRRVFPDGTCRSIASALKKQTHWVYIRLQLLDLPEKVQQMAAAGLIMQNDIEALHRVPGSPSIVIKAAERVMTSRQKHKGRQPRTGLNYRPRVYVRTREKINKMIAQMLEAGITGLAPRVAAWCAGQLTDAELEADIQADIANRLVGNDPNLNRGTSDEDQTDG